MKNKLSPKICIASFISVFIVLSVCFFYTMGFYKCAIAVSNNDLNNVETKRSDGYNFINPLLNCDSCKSAEWSHLSDMKEELADYVDESVDAGNTSHISVYFKELNNGKWMGIHHDKLYAPASLLKVPIMIAAFKKAENNPGFLKQKVFYKAKIDKQFGANIKGRQIVPGNSYTITELVQYMIMFSDNEAFALLMQTITPDYAASVMSDMGYNVSGWNVNKDFISVHDYSAFFRLLYNASYLNRDMSELALRILSRSAYKNGIVAGIQGNTAVAHKFGERNAFGPDKKQLHDCGIVYAGNTPYLICIMTKGNNFKSMTQAIADISAIVYKNVSSAK